MKIGQPKLSEKGQRSGLVVKPLPSKSKTADTLITGRNINKKGRPISEPALHDQIY